MSSSTDDAIDHFFNLPYDNDLYCLLENYEEKSLELHNLISLAAKNEKSSDVLSNLQYRIGELYLRIKNYYSQFQKPLEEFRKKETFIYLDMVSITYSTSTAEFFYDHLLLMRIACGVDLTLSIILSLFGGFISPLLVLVGLVLLSLFTYALIKFDDYLEMKPEKFHELINLKNNFNNFPYKINCKKWIDGIPQFLKDIGIEAKKL